MVLAVLLVWYFGQNVSMALFDQNKAVQLDLSTIEDSTLLIGTHLIYLHSLNDHIYEIAMQSAADSGQDRIYYKSELAGGIWMDITDAGSISDISAGGIVADMDELNSLYLTHHTKSDGLTYPLWTEPEEEEEESEEDSESEEESEPTPEPTPMTEEDLEAEQELEAVCIFNIISVYELESLPELEALKIQYDVMQQSGSTKSIGMVTGFFATDVHTEEAQQCDTQLDALQNYYVDLAENNASSKYLETTLDVMAKVNNARKVVVFTIVDEALDALLDAVVENGSADDEALLTAIGESQYALGESMMEAAGNMLSAQDGVVSEKEYTLCTDMIANAEGENFYGCDEQNLLLQYLGNINNGRIVDGAEELKLLEELIESADARYKAELSAGTTTEYEVLVSRNVSHAARENRMKEDIAGANAARSELEFLIQSVVDRRESIPGMAGSATQNYILQRIQDAAKFKSVIKQDDYAGQYQDSVSEYVLWLNSLLASIKQSGGSQGEEESLYEQKADLQEQKLAALDALDLDTAKRIDAMIAVVDEQITALEKVQSDKLKDLMAKKTALERQLAQNPQSTNLQAEISRLEAQLAAGETDLSGSSQAASIIESKNEILGILADGDTSDSTMERLGDHVALLSSMLENGSPLAMEAMKEVYTKMLAKSELENVRAYDSLQEEIETAVSESAVRAGTANEILPDSAGNVIADALGVDSLLAPDGSISSESLKKAAPDDVLAALLALGDLNREPGTDSSMEAFAGGFAAALEQNSDLPVFQTVEKQGELYVPVEVLADYLGYRYVWNQTRKTAVLSKGREFYSFTAYDTNVVTEKGESLSMDKAADFSEQLFIPGSFVQKQFGYSVFDISGTDCSVLVNDKVIEKSQDILSELLEKGGY